VISYKEFNRNKNRSVLFLHGLFSSSGFWLEHLREFRDFKIILCDIDYQNFFKTPVAYNKNLMDFCYKNNVYASISHSFASSLNLNINEATTRINICPITYKSRVNSNEFITTIIRKTGLKKKFIKEILNSSQIYLKDNQGINSNDTENMINLIPNNDIFFNYNDNSNFEGDHFNISNAINNILQLDEFSN
jgi:hypothetical protein